MRDGDVRDRAWGLDRKLVVGAGHRPVAGARPQGACPDPERPRGALASQRAADHAEHPHRRHRQRSAVERSRGHRAGGAFLWWNRCDRGGGAARRQSALDRLSRCLRARGRTGLHRFRTRLGTQRAVDRGAGILAGRLSRRGRSRLGRQQGDAAADRNADRATEGHRRLQEGADQNLYRGDRLERLSGHRGWFRTQPGWTVREVACGHDVPVDKPEELSGLLEEAAR